MKKIEEKKIAKPKKAKKVEEKAWLNRELKQSDLGEVYNLLNELMPKEAIQHGTYRNRFKATGIRAQFCINRFNDVLGNHWRYITSIIDKTPIGKRLAVTVEIKIEIGNWQNNLRKIKKTTQEEKTQSIAEYEKEGTYFEVLASHSAHGGHIAEELDDAIKGAETNCFKKCAAKFGVGRETYEQSLDEDYINTSTGKTKGEVLGEEGKMFLEKLNNVNTPDELKKFQEEAKMMSTSDKQILIPSYRKAQERIKLNLQKIKEQKVQKGYCLKSLDINDTFTIYQNENSDVKVDEFARNIRGIEYVIYDLYHDKLCEKCKNELIEQIKKKYPEKIKDFNIIDYYYLLETGEVMQYKNYKGEYKIIFKGSADSIEKYIDENKPVAKLEYELNEENIDQDINNIFE